MSGLRGRHMGNRGHAQNYGLNFCELDFLHWMIEVL